VLQSPVTPSPSDVKNKQSEQKIMFMSIKIFFLMILVFLTQKQRKNKPCNNQ